MVLILVSTCSGLEFANLRVFGVLLFLCGFGTLGGTCCLGLYKTELWLILVFRTNFPCLEGIFLKLAVLVF